MTKEEFVNEYIKKNATSKLLPAMYGDVTMYSGRYYLTLDGFEYSVGVYEQFETEEKEMEYVIDKFKIEICSRLMWLQEENGESK